jgi:hypothetical protein
MLRPGGQGSLYLIEDLITLSSRPLPQDNGITEQIRTQNELSRHRALHLTASSNKYATLNFQSDAYTNCLTCFFLSLHHQKGQMTNVS